MGLGQPVVNFLVRRSLLPEEESEVSMPKEAYNNGVLKPAQTGL